MEKPKLLLIKTGGTIDGCVPEYAEIEKISGVFNDVVNYAKHMTQSFKAAVNFNEFEVCRKDSRDINEEDRTILVQVIERGYHDGTNRFLITHGTYTMPETGKFLLDNLSSEVLENATIIMTGSMYPWSVFGSDAPMNLGASVSQLISAHEKGVWICMHGKMFDPRNVKKDVANLIFE